MLDHQEVCGALWTPFIVEADLYRKLLAKRNSLAVGRLPMTAIERALKACKNLDMSRTPAT
jgi:hypothetical protein